MQNGMQNKSDNWKEWGKKQQGKIVARKDRWGRMCDNFILTPL
jgi:hypothetical protein